jgi:hypothetical protein
VTGELNTPPEFATFNYADFLARQGVYSLIDRPQSQSFSGIPVE